MTPRQRLLSATAHATNWLRDWFPPESKCAFWLGVISVHLFVEARGLAHSLVKLKKELGVETVEQPTTQQQPTTEIADQAKHDAPKGWVGVARPEQRWGADEEGTVYFIAGRHTEAVAAPDNETMRSWLLATYRNPHTGMLRWN